MRRISAQTAFLTKHCIQVSWQLEVSQPYQQSETSCVIPSNTSWAAGCFLSLQRATVLSSSRMYNFASPVTPSTHQNIRGVLQNHYKMFMSMVWDLGVQFRSVIKDYINSLKKIIN